MDELRSDWYAYIHGVGVRYINGTVSYKGALKLARAMYPDLHISCFRIERK
jgi:hypothetical protein